MVSVCMATHNGSKYVEEQIASILAQLSSEDELIISDDGSTDSTIEKIRQFNDSRIKLLSFTSDTCIKNKVFHKMVCIQRNFFNALSNATGDYIFLADQDDVWLPHKVECCVRHLQEVECVHHNAIVVDACLRQKKVLRCTSLWRKHLFYYCIWPSFIGCCLAFRRELLLRVLSIKNLHPDEHDTLIGLVAVKDKSFRYIDEKFILYRRHGGNVSSCSEKSTLPLYIKVLRRIYILKIVLLFWVERSIVLSGIFLAFKSARKR